jgi:transposase
VNANLVFKWLKDDRFAPEVDTEQEADFLPVEIVCEPLSTAVAPPPSDGRIEIALANGHRLKMMGSHDPKTLCRLVRGLVG